MCNLLKLLVFYVTLKWITVALKEVWSRWIYQLYHIQTSLSFRLTSLKAPAFLFLVLFSLLFPLFSSLYYCQVFRLPSLELFFTFQLIYVHEKLFPINKFYLRNYVNPIVNFIRLFWKPPAIEIGLSMLQEALV